MRGKCQSEFDETYKNACFRDDTPLYIWNDAWAACLTNCADQLSKEAVKLLEQPGYELVAHHLLDAANKMRDRHEDYK